MPHTSKLTEMSEHEFKFLIKDDKSAWTEVFQIEMISVNGCMTLWIQVMSSTLNKTRLPETLKLVELFQIYDKILKLLQADDWCC